LRCRGGDPGVDFVPVANDRPDQFAGEFGRRFVSLRLSQMTLEDRARGPLAEVGLEHRGQRKAPAGPPTADPVSPRRHRR
jgi:hypothetical protein